MKYEGQETESDLRVCFAPGVSGLIFSARLCNSLQQTSVNTEQPHNSYSGWMNVSHDQIKQTLKFTEYSVCMIKHVMCVIELRGVKCTSSSVTQYTTYANTHTHTCPISLMLLRVCRRFFCLLIQSNNSFNQSNNPSNRCYLFCPITTI